MKSDRSKIETEWKEVFNTDLPKHIHKSYAVKYIKWQKLNKGFEKSLQKQINKLVENYETGISTFTPSTPLEIKAGTKLIREFKGIKYEVTKLDNGYEFESKIYKSLSAVANKITGTRWNGKKFFWIGKVKKLRNKFIKATNFSQGKAFVKIDNSEDNFCINKKGEILFVTKNRPFYDLYSVFNVYNQCIVMWNSLFGVMNSTGELVIPCEWDYIYDYSGYTIEYYKLLKGNLITFKDFSGNMIFCNKSKYNGNIVPINEYNVSIPNSVASEKDGKYGIINYRTDEIIIPFEYDDCSDFFFPNLARVKKNNRYGFINIKNKIVIPIEYEFADFRFNEGLCLVKKDGKCGFIDKENNFVISLKYGSASRGFIEGIACVEVEDRINSSYKYILPDGENAF